MGAALGGGDHACADADLAWDDAEREDVEMPWWDPADFGEADEMEWDELEPIWWSEEEEQAMSDGESTREERAAFGECER